MTTESTALMERHDTSALVQREGNAVFALAVMSEADFESRLAALKIGQERVRRIQREMMTEDEDFGIIPGTKKPTLLKPGAEKICQVYALVPTFEELLLEGDGVSTPHLRARTKCFLHVGSKEGPIVGEGIGAANSWERKHRYRSAQKACPSCGVEGSIRRSKFADRDSGDRGWYCHDKAGGCGAQFSSTDPAIVEQQGGQVDNPDPYDVENTLLKMAAKRAQVDAVLRATATSGLFTQDVEDITTSELTSPQAHTAPTPATPMRSATPAATVARPQPSPSAPQSGRPANGGGKGDQVISEPQAKRFFAIAKQAGWRDDELKHWLLDTHGYASDRDILRKDYDAICQAVVSGGGND